MIPTALRVVAIIQLFVGLYSVASVIAQLSLGHVSFNLGVLGIPIYFGLMSLRLVWRTCALVVLWYGMLLLPVAFFLGFGDGAAYFQILDIRIARISPIWVSVLSAPLFLLCLWQFRILTRPEVKALFTSAATGHVGIHDAG